MTRYISKYYKPYEHSTQEYIISTLIDKRESSINRIKPIVENLAEAFRVILNNLESDKSIYGLLRDPRGRASLSVCEEDYQVHPEEDILIQELYGMEEPMQFFNCPEATTLKDLEETLDYLDKHKDSGMETEGSVSDLVFWWEENPLGVITIQIDDLEDLRTYASNKERDEI